MLDEGVVAAPEDIDLCMIIGAGWPFHLGGITPVPGPHRHRREGHRLPFPPGLTGVPGWFSRPGTSVAACTGASLAQVAYFCTRSPTAGSAASTCLAALPRTARYVLMITGRWETSAMPSVIESNASDTSPARLAR